MFIVNMDAENCLKDRVVSEVSKYPLIKKYFGPILSDLENDTLLLENDLVYAVLMDHDEQIWFRENAMSKIIQHHQDLLPAIFSEYIDDKKGFNKRINELWSELGSVIWLIENGYTGIEKIMRQKGQKTPDYKAQKGNNTEIFEIKNLRVPEDTAYWINVKLGARRLVDINKYEHKYVVTVSPFNLPNEEFENEDIKQVEEFIQSIDNSLSSRTSSVLHHYTKTISGNKISRRLKCEIQFDQPYAIIVLGGTQIRMAGLYNKTSEKVKTALKQLRAFNSDKTYRSWILLNLQKPGGWDLFDECHSTRFRRFLRRINSILIAKKANVQIQLL